MIGAFRSNAPSAFKRFFIQNRTQIFLALICFVLYFVCIYSERHFITEDTRIAQMAWWNYLLLNGWHGIATLNNPAGEGGLGGDYTTIWYALFVLLEKIGLYPNWPLEYSLKLIAVVCSIVSAISMHFLTRHFRPQAKYLPTLAMVLTLFLPAFLLDVVKTNAPDSVYLMFMILSLLCFVKDKKRLAWLVLGFGLCFKLMAVYLIPFLAYFYIKNWRTSTWNEKLAPLYLLLSVFICSVPNALVGGSLWDGVMAPLLARSTQAMTLASFSLWQFLPNQTQHFKLFSLALLALLLLLTWFFVWKYVKKDRLARIEYPVLLTLVPLLCYFILPAQHESYFAFATIAAFLALIIVPERPFFVVFLSTNGMLFFAYCLIGFRWWYDSVNPSILEMLAIAMTITIGYLYYLLYRESTLCLQSQKEKQ